MSLARICRYSLSCYSLGLLLLLSACAGTPSTRFYLLTPLSMAESQDNISRRPIALGIGPIRLPSHLDRPEIIVEGPGHQVELAEFDQWAEPLDDNITSVLATNLAVLLGTQQVSRYPWPPGTKVDYQIGVNINRFIATSEGKVELHAHWTMQRSITDKPLLEKTERVQETPVNSTIEAIVSAQSQALAQLARLIADGVKNQVTN